MRPLVFDFPNDTEALKQQTQYMFGPSLLVCPVTEPGVETMRVYLPKYGPGWVFFDSYVSDYDETDEHYRKMDSETVYKGGQYVDIPVAPYRIPVFRKADQNIILSPLRPLKD
jgi:alpha-D-xyloside xylohydrolase